MTNTATMMKRYVNTCDPVLYDPLSTTVAISTVTPSKGNCQISNSNIQKEAGFSINLERLTEKDSSRGPILGEVCYNEGSCQQ